MKRLNGLSVKIIDAKRNDTDDDDNYDDDYDFDDVYLLWLVTFICKTHEQGTYSCSMLGEDVSLGSTFLRRGLSCSN